MATVRHNVAMVTILFFINNIQACARPGSNQLNVLDLEDRTASCAPASYVIENKGKVKDCYSFGWRGRGSLRRAGR